MTPDEAFAILELPSNVSEADLKTKYKRLVLQYHPDRNHESNATEKFIQIKKAYELALKHISRPQKQNNFGVEITINFQNGQWTGTTSSTQTQWWRQWG